jgi:pyruvate/2-oxoglutarate dehydrogenase complex dihydrolipoamide acyltransferase (E2) component
VGHSGIRLSLSLPRRIICDYLHFARQVPSVPVQRRMRIGALIEARSRLAPRPSWFAIFLKAFALISAARPQMRRAYLSFPWPHLYEHPINVISVAIERPFGDEDAVFFAPIRQPEARALGDIDRKVRELKDQPIETQGAFRRLLWIARLPLPARRLLWWVGLNGFGRKRAQYLGTAGVSVYAGLGASSLHPLSLLTTTLNYGVIEADGSVDVRITYDHRVLDGASVARALAEMERALHRDILKELRAQDQWYPPRPLPARPDSAKRHALQRDQ